MRDPWEALKNLGPSRSLFGITPWMLLALLTHTGAVASPQMTLLPMRQHVKLLKTELTAYFGSIAIDIAADEPAKPDAAPEPEPMPEPDPEPVAPETQAEEPKDEDYGEAPPAAAQAADVLNTGEEQPSQDLSSWTIVHKEGSKVTGGGYTSGEGTSDQPVMDPRASSKGKEGGRGDGTGVPAINRSRPAMPVSRNLSDCPFPPQADMAQVDRAVVDVSVRVDAGGRPLDATVVSDPGFGFGPQAKRCALGMQYQPALGPSGDPIPGATPTLRFRFNR